MLTRVNTQHIIIVTHSYLPTVDTSVVLLAPKRLGKGATLWDQVTVVFRPFSTTLWALIICMLILAGITMRFLEARHNRRLLRSTNYWTSMIKSCYLITAQPCNGEIHEPKTAFGKVYAVIVGGTLLILLCAYISSLSVSLFALSATTTVSNMKEFLNLGFTPCSLGIGSGYSASLGKLFPGISVTEISWTGVQDIASDPNICKGTVVDMATVSQWISESKFCKMQVAGPSWMPDLGGWVTNLDSQCVVRAVNYGLVQAISSAEVAIMFARWFRPAQCTGTNADTTSNSLDTTHLMGVFCLFSFVTFCVILLRLPPWPSLPRRTGSAFTSSFICGARRFSR